MSAMVSVDIELRNKEAVIAAMEELNYKLSAGEGNVFPLFDRDRSKGGLLVEVVADHSKNGGLYSDIGFRRLEDGRLEMLISDVDQAQMRERFGLHGCSYTSPQRLESMDRFNQLYGKHNTLITAQLNGWNSNVSVEEDGELVIRLDRFVA